MSMKSTYLKMFLSITGILYFSVAMYGNTNLGGLLGMIISTYGVCYFATIIKKKSPCLICR
jgi:hypothetical protein